MKPLDSTLASYVTNFLEFVLVFHGVNEGSLAKSACYKTVNIKTSSFTQKDSYGVTAAFRNVVRLIDRILVDLGSGLFKIEMVRKMVLKEKECLN